MIFGPSNNLRPDRDAVCDLIAVFALDRQHLVRRPWVVSAAWGATRHNWFKLIEAGILYLVVRHLHIGWNWRKNFPTDPRPLFRCCIDQRCWHHWLCVGLSLVPRHGHDFCLSVEVLTDVVSRLGGPGPEAGKANLGWREGQAVLDSREIWTAPLCRRLGLRCGPRDWWGLGLLYLESHLWGFGASGRAAPLVRIDLCVLLLVVLVCRWAGHRAKVWKAPLEVELWDAPRSAGGGDWHCIIICSRAFNIAPLVLATPVEKTGQIFHDIFSLGGSLRVLVFAPLSQASTVVISRHSELSGLFTFIFESNRVDTLVVLSLFLISFFLNSFILDLLHEKGIKFFVVQTPLEIWIVSIFDLIICTTINMSRHFTPARIILQEKFNDQEIFFEGPLFLYDIRIKMMMPALATLFTYASWKSLGNLSPILCAIWCDKLRQ